MKKSKLLSDEQRDMMKIKINKMNLCERNERQLK